MSFQEVLITIILALITAFFTATTTYWGYWRKARADLEKEFEQRINERKWLVYNEVVDLIRRYFLVTSSEIDKMELRLPAELVSNLSLIASDEVVAAWTDFWSFAAQSAESEDYTAENYKLAQNKLMRILVVMRKDLGHKSTPSIEGLWQIFESFHRIGVLAQEEEVISSN